MDHNAERRAGGRRPAIDEPIGFSHPKPYSVVL